METPCFWNVHGLNSAGPTVYRWHAEITYEDLLEKLNGLKDLGIGLFCCR
jgi:hypothetical protein